MNDGHTDAATVPVPDAVDDTLRVELVGPLFGLTLDRTAGGRLLTAQDATRIIDALLPLIRDHVERAVEQARADERERLCEQLDDYANARGAAVARAEKAEAAIERARAVHREHTNTGLVERCKCLACDMARALEGSVTP